MPRIIQRKYGTFQKRKDEAEAHAKRKALEDENQAKLEAQMRGAGSLTDKDGLPRNRANMALMVGLALLGDIDK